MSKRQSTMPLLIRDGRAARLEPIPYDERHFTEDQLQALLFQYPDLLPASEIEPVFEYLIPVCRELPTAVGPLDLLYLTAEGNLALVETKLWRNPEARRSVVAQLIDYTKELARWSYSDLCDAVRRAKGNTDSDGDPLVSLVRDEVDDLDESDFHDLVSRNLRLGRFLLLIVGDGIREDVEHMAEFLQQTPQLGYTLGLIEIGLHRLKTGSDDSLFVQPRVVARTKEVIRAVVEIRNRAEKDVQVEVSLPPPGVMPDDGGPITEEQFLEWLVQEDNPPEVIEFAHWVIEQAGKHDLIIEWGSSGPLLKYVHPATGDSFTFGQLARKSGGTLGELRRFAQMCQKTGLPDAIWDKYLTMVEHLIPDSNRFMDGVDKRGRLRTDVRMGPSYWNDRPQLKLIAPQKEAWFRAIDEAVEQIRKALDERME
ncbi:MAG: hypothetical protein IT445_00445 [Phycisphaeraceae bacterium]|nr:hypothetical protein [Phycisphaeraceae bacterium]